jgi:hypothetical protein
MRGLWNGKDSEPMAPEVKRWKRIDLLFTGLIIVGSGMVVAALFVIGWKLAGL